MDLISKGFDTIAAISTPIGKGGIGIIRISGANSFSIIEKLFKRKGDKSNSSFKIQKHCYHKLMLGKIYSKDESFIDEVLICAMREPKSYTKENTVEIHAHSGIANVMKILEIVLENGARLAEPGEFTKRAFLNGRIDLLKAEGIIEIINANSKEERKAASKLVSGESSKVIESISNSIDEELSKIEATIEFSEEIDFENAGIKNIIFSWKNLIVKPIKELLRNSEKCSKYLKTTIITIVGNTNVGKSSLLNRIVENHRAIVSPISGTTRDIIEAPANIAGVDILIQDTAGIRETIDPVEMMGIKKAKEAIEKSEIILLVIDSEHKISRNDLEVVDLCKNKNLMIVENKADIYKRAIKDFFPKEWANIPYHRISALTGIGISELLLRIENLCNQKSFNLENSVLINSRQISLLKRALKTIERGLETFSVTGNIELLISDLYESKSVFDMLLGTRFNKNIIEKIFGMFCVGK